ncbi:hypothetical protein M6B38_159630 [Iris pallida]|uniref:Uncharacterized protein n=1 Tax=Iris pallida TaxID=29817 RepID=A0AAX6F129_IRIPA|nr:hypothetical protein M6B38_159630 [Iris pallida]
MDSCPNPWLCTGVRFVPRLFPASCRVLCNCVKGIARGEIFYLILKLVWIYILIL